MGIIQVLSFDVQAAAYRYFNVTKALPPVSLRPDINIFSDFFLLFYILAIVVLLVSSCRIPTISPCQRVFRKEPATRLGSTVWLSTQHDTPSGVSHRAGSIGVMWHLSGPCVGDSCNSWMPACVAWNRQSRLASCSSSKTPRTVTNTPSWWRMMWTRRSLSWGARYAIDASSCSLYVVGKGSDNVFLRRRCLSMNTECDDDDS